MDSLWIPLIPVRFGSSRNYREPLIVVPCAPTTMLEQNVFNITLKSFDDKKVLKIVNWIC